MGAHRSKHEGEPSDAAIAGGRDNRGAAADPGEIVEAVQCAICLQDEPLILMPCCGKESSSTRFCNACITLVCNHSGGVGACPKCRADIHIRNGRVQLMEQKRGKCQTCRQTRVLVTKTRCAACDLGSKKPLRYKCDRCNRTQRIPHPMYRYQNTPEEASGATWACHQRCGDYTHWTIVPEDVGRVPRTDAPEKWKLFDKLIEDIREERQTGKAPSKKV